MSLRPSRPDADGSELHRAIARLSVNDIERLGASGGYAGGSAVDEDARLARQMALQEARDRALALSMQMDEEDLSVALLQCSMSLT